MPHAYKPSVDSEMHELNAEADLLEQKTTVVAAGTNGEDTKLQAHNSDPDAQAMVIESLRAQVQDLFSQVTQLNGKLVRSYDRVSDLEDELHVASSNLRQATLKNSQLELERTQHLSALSTGLLVEKSHVTTELNRLMERATEEAARRGQAESARAEIEKELDDLSAGLFNQANTMVAEARMSEARSARKLEETETALRGAEEIVGVLQAQMQALQSEKEHADRRVEEMRARMGKGKWVERSPDGPRPDRPRLMSAHVPYHEFVVFISHLRAIRPASAQPPAMSTLLPLPFLARLVAEDSDPTVRLDLAPSLNWLSRRSVLAAIHGGQLTVEPMQFTNLLEELAPQNIPASSHHTHIVCALCGLPIYSSSSDSPGSTPTTPNGPRSGSQSASWSTNLFKNVRSGDITLPTAFTGHNRHSAQFAPANAEPPSQVYIFRLEATSSGLPVSLPLSSQPPGTPTRQSTIYPLCTTGWCLARLRTTCSLWAYVRTSIVEKVWEEPPFTERPNGIAKTRVNGVEKRHDAPNGVSAAPEGKPAIPVRRSKIGLSSLWGSMQRTLSGPREPEKDAVKVNDAEKKDDTRPKLPPRDPSRKSLPPPPPVHPSIAAHSHTKSIGQVHAVPPPLPKRNRERDTNGASRPSTPSLEQKPAPSVPPPPPTEAPELPPRRSESEQPKEEPAPGPQTTLVVPPASVSRTESQDSFTTPTEELAPAFTVSPAATTVPLPPSQAPTPEPQEPPSPTEPLAPESHESATPTEAAPAPAAATPAAVQDDNKPPSRTASPAPPPLPRRAAARARPSSIVPAAAAAEAAAPVPETAQPTEQKADEAAPTDAPATATASASEPSPEPTPASSDAAAHVEDSAPITEEPESVVTVESSETPADAAAPAPDAEGEQKTGQEEAGSEADEKQEAPAVNGDAPVVVPVVDTHTDSDTKKTEEAEKEDQGQYVGDATWEERTYKELVRLREEMFWARIGAVVH